jgi:hypothetical protein
MKQEYCAVMKSNKGYCTSMVWSKAIPEILINECIVEYMLYIVD